MKTQNFLVPSKIRFLPQYGGSSDKKIIIFSLDYHLR